ncbi:MAG TPA: glycosyltransferase family 2 protein [Burkholderiaceae bacterium]|jgi:N-acetylglucosaminyl-diphospho-decaprenol L-rhamnosyltransferase|nr:glycosyltransferase family 2 protein [Burkholderiaceae bacterium]
MEICAIILDYRGALKTEACLKSLVSEGINTVLVVDNSADVQSSQQLDDALSRLSSNGIDYRLHILKPGDNLGFAGGVNFALAHAAGMHCDTILLLNNDASVMRGALLKLSNALTEDATSLVGPAIVDDDGIAQPMLWYQRFFGIQSKRVIPGAFPYLSGCCLLFRRQLLDAGKLLDETFFMYGEDTLLGWRMHVAQNPVKLVESAVVRHTGQNPAQQCTMFYEYQMARAHLLLATKTYRYRMEIPLLLFTKFFGLMLRAILRSLRYRKATPFLALLLAWMPLNIRKSV